MIRSSVISSTSREASTPCSRNVSRRRAGNDASCRLRGERLTATVGAGGKDAGHSDSARSMAKLVKGVISPACSLARMNSSGGSRPCSG